MYQISLYNKPSSSSALTFFLFSLLLPDTLSLDSLSLESSASSPVSLPLVVSPAPYRPVAAGLIDPPMLFSLPQPFSSPTLLPTHAFTCTPAQRPDVATTHRRPCRLLSRRSRAPRRPSAIPSTPPPPS